MFTVGVTFRLKTSDGTVAKEVLNLNVDNIMQIIWTFDEEEESTLEERPTHPHIPLDQDVMVLKNREVPRCVKSQTKQKTLHPVVQKREL